MPHALIVGGGYAGVAAARSLAVSLPSPWHITVADRRPHHELLTRLPEVVAGSLDPSLARIPYADILPGRVRFICTDVLSIDSDRQVASTTSGDINWDTMILAAGVEPWNAEGAGGLGPTFPVRSVAHAEALRDTLAGLLVRSGPVRVVIIGTGYTGSEVAGELLSLPDARRLHVSLLSDSDRVLPQGNPRLARIVDLSLRAQGAELHLGIRIEQIHHNEVRLVDGRSFPADVIIWAGQAHADTRWQTVMPRAESGRLQTDVYLRTSQPNVFAIGDVSIVKDVPANAQVAIEEGRVAAANLVRTVRREPLREFRLKVLGEALTLGPHAGVAEILGVVVTGGRAHAVKAAALTRYLFTLGGLPLVRRYTRDIHPSSHK